MSVVTRGGYCASEVRSMQYRRIQNALGLGYCCNRVDHGIKGMIVACN